jgi:hypothetical protein
MKKVLAALAIAATALFSTSPAFAYYHHRHYRHHYHRYCRRVWRHHHWVTICR